VKIWVDLVNSPQVLTLGPVMTELERRGHDLIITTRDFAQTVQLADRAGLSHTPLGKHGGANRAKAVQVNIERAIALVRFVREQRADLALSHNSYSQAVAARLVGIPFVTMMDYEHQRVNHLAFRLARRVLVPQVFPESALRACGAVRKTVRYPGLKEELYLGQFEPDPGFVQASGLPVDRPLVVLRPPGYWADYYRGGANLFSAVIGRVLAHPDAYIVFLPRIRDQSALVRDVPPDKLLVAANAVDGPNLLFHSDVVVSAGGTMNREAAILGTPAYTVFEGPLGAVDKSLVAQGRLVVLQGQLDIDRMRIEKKQTPDRLPPRRVDLTQFVTDAIMEAV
jgi:predicted glycosyltransferase